MSTTISIRRSQGNTAPLALANGELAYSYASDKLYIGQTDTAGSPTSIELIGGKYLVDTVAGLSNSFSTQELTSNNVHVSGNLTVNGDIILRGDSLTLGDGGDVVNLNATVNNSIIPTTDASFDLGSSTNKWENLHVSNTVNADVGSFLSLILTNALQTQYGGTGLSTFVQNGVLVGANSSALMFVEGTPGQVLQIAANGTPYFGDIDGGSF